MGLWILEPHSDEKVPGTVHIGRETEEQAALTSKLKHGKGRFAKVVLTPQPSDSPNDPLNWSTTTKYFHSIFLSAGTGLMTGTNNFVNPGQNIMAKQLHTSITVISRSVSLILLLLGVGAMISSPAARIWGKRPVFIVGNLVALVGYVIVVAKPTSLGALYAGRSIHGLGIGGIEFLVSSSVGDLFFVHQRGIHLAIWHFALQGGNSIGQVIGGQIIQAQSWVWAFRWCVIILAVYNVALFLFIPETTYNRATRLNTDFHEHLDAYNKADQPPPSIRPSQPADNATDSGNEKDGIDTVADTTVTTANDDIEGQDQGQSGSAAEKKHTFLQSLKVYNGRFSDEKLIDGIVSPFAAFLLPAVLWTAYAYGCSVAFSASFSVCIAQVFSAPPYNFNPHQTGLTVIGSFIGSLLGNIFPGRIADWLVKYASRKNNGVYEPEFRNLLCIPAFFFGLAGFWGFGLSLQAKNHWIVPTFFFGLSTFAGSILSLVSNAYLLDCHRAQSQDGYAAVTLGRGIFSFVMTFVINDWINRDGIATVYFVIGSLHGLACILGMVLYVFGKRIRLWVSKNKFIQSKLGKPRYVAG
ncbi:Major facilitator superfamily domain, general substrate transporter [Niveomyces insectorum RCEF 264]|uniref:Major facilitator superfamily domain, general substrate transporter n=1 Tax=Niveomyces insectorum RCEF 264 TaxID=1081102 RepID=A0A167WER3_9HYPO|nr:Major facilitator superfamily domain, general substrate transporter [Niveomyces insectorum RCEF 264]